MGTTSQYFSDVHATVLRQHAEIRARLRGLDAAASPASPVSRAFLRISLLRLATLFDSHLAFEEAELAPRIRELDAWGPVRESAMRAEHIEQRTRLQRVCAMAEEDSVDDVWFASEASWLVVSLLEDMAHEELELSALEEIDEYGAGQMTG